MTPKIGLAYNSQQGNGPLGVGWGISGLSSITRSNKSFFYDNDVDGIKMNSSDAFMLDGIKLIELSSSATEKIYQTNRGNIKVKAHITAGDVAYFEVFYPNGNKAVFGNKENKSPCSIFPITSISDMRGNKVEFIYTQTALPLILRINYNNNSIRFNYKNRTDTSFAFMGGEELNLSTLLDNIECYYGNYVICKYSLEYQSTSQSNARLTSIGYSAGADTLNPLKFSYGGSSLVFLNKTSSTNLSRYYEYSSIVCGKLNYAQNIDGVICYPTSNPYWCQYEKNGSYYFRNLHDYRQNIYVYKNIFSSTGLDVDSIQLGDGFIDVFCADLTGTQQESIIKVNNIHDDNKETLTYTVYDAAPSGISKRYERVYELYTVNNMSGQRSLQPKSHYAGDFDGDGQMEILAVSAHKPFGTKSLPTRCYLFELETGELRYEGEPFEYTREFYGSKQADSQKVADNTDKLFIIDYDGDGKNDICHIHTGGTDIYEFNNEYLSYLKLEKIASFPTLKLSDATGCGVLPCDINGDGITDLAVSPKNDGNSATWTYYYGTGIGTFKKKVADGPRYYKDYSFFLQDINSDGIADLIRTNPTGAQVFIGNGATFSENPCGHVPFADKTANTSIIPVSLVTRNHFPQLLAYQGKGKVEAYCSSDYESLSRLCVGMTNSLGVVESNTYTLATDTQSGICTKGTGAVFPYINMNEQIPLLTSVERSVEGIKISSDRYTYQNPVFHKYGLGFIGFEGIKKKDIKNQEYEQMFDIGKYGFIFKDDSPLKLEFYNYSYVKDANGMERVLIPSFTSYDKLNDVLNRITMSYDSYGNISNKTEQWSDGLIVKEEYTYLNNDTVNDGYYIGFLKDKITTSQNKAKISVENESVSSYDRGLPAEKNTKRNGLQLKNESFEYYANGLVKSITEKSYSSSKKFKTANEYDEFGHLTQTIDKFGFKTEYTYYSGNGLVKTKTDKTGTTKYSYDGLGRNINRSDPVNSSIATIYEWDSSRNGGYYCVTEKVDGIPKYTYFDPLNRDIRKEEMRVDGNKSAVDKEYDSFGNVKSISYPHKSVDSASLNTTYEYDSFGRKISETEPSGKQNTFGYGYRQTTETINGITTTKSFNSHGDIIKIESPDGTVEFKLNSLGQPDTIVAPGGIKTTFVYDGYGRLTSRTDPSLGTETFTYDLDGNLKTQTNARGQSTSYSYDGYNRITKMTTPEMTVNYTYDSATGYMTSIKSSNGFTRTLIYDAPGRVISKKEDFDGHSLSSKYIYGAGLLRRIEYTSGTGMTTTETHVYRWDKISSIMLNDSIKVYEVIKVNDFGQPTKISSGGMSTTYSYDEYGSLTGRKDSWGNEVLSDVSLDFDPYNGNLLSRTDNRRGITEQFEYDGLNRLTDYGDNYVNYSSNGNIAVKSDAGMFAYGNTSKPYALTHAVFADPKIPTRDQNITYSSFMRPLTLSENDYGATFTYGPEFDRIKMVIDYYSSWTLKRYYLGGSYEFDRNNLLQLAGPVEPADPLPGIPIDTYDTDGLKDPGNPGVGVPIEREDLYDVERIYIGGDAYTAPAVLVKRSGKKGSTNLYFIVRDHVGSIVALVGDGGKIVEENSYDAWGRMRDPETHEVYLMDKVPGLTLGRGYGSHEYLHRFGLVNMNARLYDPVLGRFLSPDPYVQDPTLPQNFNRYSYCLNNPLCYVDPDGEFFFTAITATIDLFRNILQHGVKFKDYSFKRTENAWNIDKGMFQGNIGQIINKWTWGLVNSFVGNITAHYYNIAGKVDKVTQMDGMLALSGPSPGNSAFTIGHYSFGPRGYRADWHDHLFVHEYGHYIQSQILGPIYLQRIALPSLISAAIGEKLTGIDHSSRWFEVTASYLGARHFDKKYGRGKAGYKKGSPDYFDIDSFRNANTSSPYINPRNNTNNYLNGNPIYKFSLTWLDFYFLLF